MSSVCAQTAHTTDYYSIIYEYTNMSIEYKIKKCKKKICVRRSVRIFS